MKFFDSSRRCFNRQVDKFLNRNKQTITMDIVKTDPEPYRHPRRYSCDVQLNDINNDYNDPERRELNLSTKTFESIDLHSNSSYLNGQVRSTPVEYELYVVISKERDELKKQNDSLKKELYYSKFMLEGYKNAYTALELQLKTQDSNKAAPVAKYPNPKSRTQLIEMPSIPFLNRDIKNVENEQDRANIKSFPGSHEWNTYGQKEKNTIAKDIDIDIAGNKKPNSNEDKQLIRRGLSFFQSQIKRKFKYNQDINLRCSIDTSDLSVIMEDDIMEDILLDRNDEEADLYYERCDDTSSVKNAWVI